MDEALKANLTAALKHMQEMIHSTAQEKGWWENFDHLRDIVPDDEKDHVDLLYKTSRTMLMVTELSEGVEALRHGDPPDDKVPTYSGFTVELADTIIRILDLAEKFKLPVVESMLDKMEVNTGRSHCHGGKRI